MDFSFDIRGNLQPPKIIDLSFEDLEQIFVLTFEETSTRHQIFANYQQFLTEIQEIIPQPLYNGLMAVLFLIVLIRMILI